MGLIVTVCVLCGRVGSRGYVLLSGTMDGTRDSWCCASEAACERRQRANPPLEYQEGDDCQSCGLPAAQCGHVRPESK